MPPRPELAPRRRPFVDVVVHLHHALACYPPLEHGRLEVVLTAEVVEPDDPVDDLAEADERDGWEDHDEELLDEERRLLGVEFHEAALDVLRRDDGEVLVDDLAARGGRAVEVAHDQLALLRRLEKLLLAVDLVKLPVPFAAQLHPLIVLLLHLLDALLADAIQVVLIQLAHALGLRVDLVLDRFGNVHEVCLKARLRHRFLSCLAHLSWRG
mmetsp:Transcript_14170/g.34302  ORF Transcript_14170/g.34302 Transcript_14170/m.34302 type:complete len:212 (-) Transcript_14170:46-681(-)